MKAEGNSYRSVVQSPRRVIETTESATKLKKVKVDEAKERSRKAKAEEKVLKINYFYYTSGSNLLFNILTLLTLRLS